MSAIAVYSMHKSLHLDGSMIIILNSYGAYLALTVDLACACIN